MENLLIRLAESITLLKMEISFNSSQKLMCPFLDQFQVLLLLNKDHGQMLNPIQFMDPSVLKKPREVILLLSNNSNMIKEECQSRNSKMKQKL